MIDYQSIVPTLTVCIFYPAPSEGGSLLRQSRNKRDILNTTLLTRITAHKQSLPLGSKHKYHIQLHGNDINE